MFILYFYRLLFYFKINHFKEKEVQFVNGYVVLWTEELFKKKNCPSYIYVYVTPYLI